MSHGMKFRTSGLVRDFNAYRPAMGFGLTKIVASSESLVKMC
jgi:hypothetical protein